jgi:hypothetical protein
MTADFTLEQITYGGQYPESLIIYAVRAAWIVGLHVQLIFAPAEKVYDREQNNESHNDGSHDFDEHPHQMGWSSARILKKSEGGRPGIGQNGVPAENFNQQMRLSGEALLPGLVRFPEL